ncbi:GH22672 [Drosophila grimshawi]|uniref:GH22672 n=1 Tax=Drosophila grimshawi TaxID=7222 RepID=B4JVH8_DROGR|nr:GH22672 [Drosophila grimshawi]
MELWSDAALQLKVSADDGTSELECVGVAEVLDALVKANQTIGFYSNPNLHSSVQGRIDPYGLVVAHCCGTLHSEHRSVGVFECSFGLLRDPHACNNWVSKKFKCLLRSATSPLPLYTLTEYDTLQ